jgi:hypothetical protein
MKREYLINVGFRELPHQTIGNVLIFDLGRNRHLSLSSFQTPNEVLYICERDRYNEKEITDLICIHNYDYDGYLTAEKLSLLITFFIYKSDER